MYCDPITSQIKTTEDRIIEIMLECSPSLSCNWDPPEIIVAKNKLKIMVNRGFLEEAKTIKIDKKPYPPEIAGTNLWWKAPAWTAPAIPANAPAIAKA